MTDIATAAAMLLVGKQCAAASCDKCAEESCACRDDSCMAHMKQEKQSNEKTCASSGCVGAYTDMTFEDEEYAMQIECLQAALVLTWFNTNPHHFLKLRLLQSGSAGC